MAGVPKSYGYPVEKDANGNVTNGITAAILAEWLVKVAGARFSVGGKDDLKVSVQAGMDRGIRINAGTAVGDSVMDVFPDYDTLPLPAPSGSSQWFLIVIRRNWSTPASTNFAVVPGTAARAIPASGVRDAPGQESDQAIALVRVQAGNTVVQDIVDLRGWAGNGGVEAADVMGREQLARPGALVYIGGTVHRYKYEAANGGSFGWVVTPIGDSGWVNIGGGVQGFSALTTSGWSGLQFRVVNGWAMINGAVTRATPWGNDTACATISADLAPSMKIQGVGCQIIPAGAVANVSLPAGSTAASFSAMWPLKV